MLQLFIHICEFSTRPLVFVGKVHTYIAFSFVVLLFYCFAARSWEKLRYLRADLIYQTDGRKAWCDATLANEITDIIVQKENHRLARIRKGVLHSHGNCPSRARDVEHSL